MEGELVPTPFGLLLGVSHNVGLLVDQGELDDSEPLKLQTQKPTPVTNIKYYKYFMINSNVMTSATRNKQMNGKLLNSFVCI